MRFIWHPIGLEDLSRTYGRSRQKVGCLVERNVRLLSILCLQCNVICYTQNGRQSMNSWTLSSFHPPRSIAINSLLSLKLSTIYGYFQAVTTFTEPHKPSPGDLDLFKQQNQHSVTWHVNLPFKWSLSHLETQGLSSALPRTRYPDTTSIDIGTTVLWCLGAVR